MNFVDGIVIIEKLDWNSGRIGVGKAAESI
jgi:hypothetical protein